MLKSVVIVLFILVTISTVNNAEEDYEVDVDFISTCTVWNSTTGHCAVFTGKLTGKLNEITAPCFHGKSSVLTPDGYVLISDLKIGDNVIGYDEYNSIFVVTPLKGYLHRHINGKYNYLEINTTGGQLVVSERHSVSIFKKYNSFEYLDFIHAGNLNIGDEMLCSDYHRCKITYISNTEHTGAYAPYVEYPFIVDNHLVHSFAEINIEGYNKRKMYEYTFHTLYMVMKMLNPNSDYFDSQETEYYHPIAKYYIDTLKDY